MASRRSVVGKAVIVEVDLRASLLEDRNDVVKRAQAVGVVRASGVGVVQRDHSIVTTE